MRFIVVQFEFHDRSVSKHLPVSGIEMFHAAQGQNETRAPIRAMTVMDINGVSTVVAAYMCTTLITVPVADLQDGANITGRTIA